MGEKIIPVREWTEIQPIKETHTVRVEEKLICCVPKRSGWEIESATLGRDTLTGDDDRLIIVAKKMKWQRIPQAKSDKNKRHLKRHAK